VNFKHNRNWLGKVIFAPTFIYYNLTISIVDIRSLTQLLTPNIDILNVVIDGGFIISGMIGPNKFDLVISLVDMGC